MNRNINIVSVTILVVAVIAGISMAYAAFSQTLTINGTATAKQSSWNIKFANLKTAVKTGTATEVSTPKLSDTSILGFSLSVKTPGDSASYTFDIVNSGSFNAKISSITVGKPSCTITTGGATTDATNVCANLTYTLQYTSNSANVAANDTLNAGETKTVKLTLTYSSSITSDKLPTKDVNIGGLTTTINYTQV